MLAPQLEALIAKHPTAKLRMIDVDGAYGGELARQHGVRGIPHLVLFENGQQIYTARDFRFQPQATIALIALNVVTFFAQQGSSITNDGFVAGFAVAEGEWWRLVTAGFLHTSLLHIGQ